MAEYIYRCTIFASINNNEEAELTLPCDNLPDGELKFIYMDSNNFGLNLCLLDRVDVRALNELLKDFNSLSEYRQSIVLALFFNSRNKTINDFRKAFHFRNDFEALPRYGIKGAELNAGEFLFESLRDSDTEEADALNDDALYLAIFYMGLRSRDIIIYEEYYYVRVNNHRRIYGLEDMKYITQMLMEEDYYA